MSNGIDLNGVFMSTLLFLETKAYGAIKTLNCTQSQVIVCDAHTCMLISLSPLLSPSVHPYIYVCLQN